MSKIIAKGMFHNNEIMSVVCEDMKFTFNGEKDDLLEKLVLEGTSSLESIGGTFYPRKNTMFAVKIVLEESFFKELESIEVTSDIETIPYVEGRIY